MPIKVGASIALAIVGINMLLGFGRYALFAFDLDNVLGVNTMIITKVYWPVSIVMSSLPVIILSFAILTDRTLDS